MAIAGLTIIGERINPGFKSTRALFENQDLAGIQALAHRQVEAGAACLNVNIGNRALDDSAFMAEVIRAIQAVVGVPLSFDFPSPAVQEVCLKTYDPDKAGGAKPIINSISETREEMLDLLAICPARVVLMASERLEDGVGRPNKTAREVADVARRMSRKLAREHAMALEDIFIDVSISTLASDTEGLVRMALDGIGLIGDDPEMAGVHIMGGLSNIGNMLPKKALDGSNLQHKLECVFLTLAVPRGFDVILGTPWKDYALLPEDDFVLGIFREVIARDGLDALRHVRRFYKAA